MLLLCAQWQTHKFKPEFKGQFEHFTKLLTNAGWYTPQSHFAFVASSGSLTTVRYLLESSAWNEEIELMKTAFESCEDQNGLDYAHLCNTHACVQVERGKADAAKDLLDDALRIRSSILGLQHIETGHSWNNYGNALQQEYLDEAAPAKAADYYINSMNTQFSAEPGERLRISYPVLLNISRAYRLMHKYDLGLEYIAKAEESVAATFPKGTHFDAT